MSRRSLIKALGASAGAATLGVGVASASDGARHIQVPEPSDLCATVPGDHNLALIERDSHQRGRGFYAGTNSQTWAFVGWLEQTRPSETARGSVSPNDDASRPGERLLQVRKPGDLKQYEPGDHHLAFVEDPSHEKGRGFYAGGSGGKWYFVGWLAQSGPSGTASGSVSAGKDSSQPGDRILQVRQPDALKNHDPTDHHLAFIEDPSHEKGRGFYAGGSKGKWYFVGWLAQTRPEGTASDTVDPNASDCGSGSTSDSGGDSGGDTTSGSNLTFETDSVSNGAWCWWADEVDSYESWLADDVKVASIGHGKHKWENFVDFACRDFPEWVDGGSGRVFLPHIPMVPWEEVDSVGRTTALRNLAEGQYNDKFRTMAENFKAAGFTAGTLALRIGNEFNIKVAPYTTIGTDVGPETWIEGYRQIVDTCRDVLGNDLRTVWAPLVHSAQMPSDRVVAHYPGAEYAMVGADIYDTAPAYEKTSKAPQGIDYDTGSASERKTVQEYVWKENHLGGDKWGNDGVGLNDIAALADDVGRQIVVPEWGLTFDEYEWGGDVNPTFVQNMYDWMNEHDVAFHSYFEHDTPSDDHALGNDGEFDFAEAGETYQQTFGGKSSSSGDSSDGSTDDGTVDSTNYVFVTESEIETRRQRAENGTDPWKTAYDNLVSDADKAMSASLRSVTDDGDHEFKRDSDRHDYGAAIDMSEWARDCAMAYQYTGKDKYAERAVEIIHHWCLGGDTYMVPTVNIVNNRTTIEQHITIPALVYAAALVRGHPAWDSYGGKRPWDGGDSGDAESAFAQWVSDRHDTFASSRPGWCEYNNKWAWRIADRAASAAYLGDDAKVDTAKCMWKGQCASCDGKERPWNDFVNNYRDSRAYDGSANPRKNGLFKHEIHRSTAFGYSAYNLKAMTLSLLVFKRYDGTNLYDYNAPSDNKTGSSLWKAFNWLEEYTEDTSAWKWDDDPVSRSAVEGATTAYELAYAHWGDFEGALKDPDKIGGRPYYDGRVLGHLTLTHGAK
ncbi:MAG: alginate lyase family protein [Haloarculaceae archaeon]